MITSDDLAFFGVVSASASLADAARKLNVTPPAITQRLKALEERIGVRLVDRTSRGLNLTDEGELLASEGASIVDLIERLGDRLGGRTSQVRGKLRIAAPHGFGRQFVAPVAQEFARQHPEATVSLELSDHPNVLTSDGWDLVVHIGALASTNRLMTTLASNRRILCAAPDYLDAHPPISQPEDLQRHRCLVVQENNEDVTLWRFSHARHGVRTIRVKPSMATNDGTIMRSWAKAGLGIIVRSEWDVADDIASGALVPILPEWETPGADVVALLSPRHGRTRRASVFLEMMKRSLDPLPWRPASAARPG